MIAWLLSLWARLPAGLRRALAVVGAAIAAAFALFFLGRRRGRALEAAEQSEDRSRENVARIEDRAAAGDDAGVQRELARATARARRRKR